MSLALQHDHIDGKDEAGRDLNKIGRVDIKHGKPPVEVGAGFVVAHGSDLQFPETEFAAQILVKEIRGWRLAFHIRLGGYNLGSGHLDLDTFQPEIISPEAVLEAQSLEILQRGAGEQQGLAIGKIHHEPAAVGLGEFPPTALKREKGQIMLPTADSLGD
jgi:hypothetical protein